MPEDANTSGGFWRTFPGVVTATAGLLTAVGGLLLALHQAGLIGRSGEGATRAGAGTAVESTAIPPGSTTLAAADAKSTIESTAGGPPASGSLNTPPVAHRVLPVAGLQVKVAEAFFRVRSAELVGAGDGRSELRLVVQVENTNAASPMSVGPTSFRLRLPGGMPLPPSEELILRYLDPTSGGEFNVVFEVPDTARAAQLTFHHDQRGVDRTVTLGLSAASTTP